MCRKTKRKFLSMKRWKMFQILRLWSVFSHSFIQPFLSSLDNNVFGWQFDLFEFGKFFFLVRGWEEREIEIPDKISWIWIFKLEFSHPFLGESYETNLAWKSLIFLLKSSSKTHPHPIHLKQSTIISNTSRNHNGINFWKFICRFSRISQFKHQHQITKKYTQKNLILIFIQFRWHLKQIKSQKIYF